MKKELLAACLICAAPLAAETKVLVFSGSTRSESYNKKLAHEAAEMARQLGATVTEIDLKDYPIPFYDGDLELAQGMPANAKKFRKLMIENDAIIIASAEYNGSLSAVLKNAIDWASRKEEGGSSREAFKGKRFAIMSASPSKNGGIRGLAHLRTIIENVGGEVIQKQVAVSSAHEVFNDQGVLENCAFKEALFEEVEQLLQVSKVK